ncbi:unnamed protein product [Phyllotreta striolata]|uniref:Methyltransferase domain-containing protein n=1 Tax=Phyllotreta striolata TaxID=444603 RepID=A0A9N9TVA3_PHYSR|nr:unnamed protein product [Phyllotreta striolata]
MANVALKKWNHALNWKKNESILEIGMGPGYNSEKSLIPLIPKDYNEFIGSDVSKEMLDYLNKNCLIPKSKFVFLDVMNEPPVEYQNRFDHIFGFTVMHRLIKPRNGFASVFKMLKPGGTAFLTFFDRAPIDDVFDRMRFNTLWNKYKQGEMVSTHYYTEDPYKEYIKDIEAAGFEKYWLDKDEMTYVFGSSEECYNLLTSVNTSMAYIPKELHEKYSEDLRKELDRGVQFTKIYKNGQETFELKFNQLILIGNKL